MFAGALHSLKNWKSLRLLVLIIVAGALALLIAPSSAVLLQRSQNVPAGGTAYFLPVAPEKMWSNEVNGAEELPECFGEYTVQMLYALALDLSLSAVTS